MSAPPLLVSDPEQVTPDWLGAVLEHAGVLPTGRVVSFEKERVGTGQVGRNVRFHLAYDRAPSGVPRSIVAKFMSSDPLSRATGIAQNTYLREVRFYREIAETVRIRVPRCYFAEIDEASHDFVLVMEDLAPARQGDQIVGCSVEQAALALEQLARLHAPRWGDPTLASYDWMSRPSPESAQLLETFYGSVWSGFAERFGARLAPESLALAERLGGSLARWAAPTPGPWTVTHGDYRLDNMLFGGADLPLAVVDWQTTGHGPGVGDASYFLGAGLAVEERRRNERALVREYHRALTAGGVEGLSWDECWQQYRRYAFAGVVMAVVASMIVGRSERGDDMFTAMAERHATHALDLGAEEFLA